MSLKKPTLYASRQGIALNMLQLRRPQFSPVSPRKLAELVDA